MAKNKYTLMTIIALLVIFVPAAIYGTITHILTKSNINHDYKYGNKLYFSVLSWVSWSGTPASKSFLNCSASSVDEKRNPIQPTFKLKQ